MFFRKDGSASGEWAPLFDGVIRSDRDTVVRNVTLEAQNAYTTQEVNSYSSIQPFNTKGNFVLFTAVGRHTNPCQLITAHCETVYPFHNVVTVANSLTAGDNLIPFHKVSHLL
jgi:hypothetical protein